MCSLHVSYFGECKRQRDSWSGISLHGSVRYATEVPRELASGVSVLLTGLRKKHAGKAGLVLLA